MSDAHILRFLSGLRRDSGAFADAPESEGALRPTLSVLKVLEMFGEPLIAPHTVEFIRRCRTDVGGFGATPGAAPTPLDTAAGLIALRTLGEDGLLQEVLPAALAFLSAHAASRFDHFMLIAAYEECRVDAPVPAASAAFFEELLSASIAANKVIDAAIAGSALMRAHRALPDAADLLRRLHAGQNTAEGGHGDGEHATLFGTYCVMRQLALLESPPNTRRMRDYIATLRTELGYADAPGGKTTAGATYQCLGILDWIERLQRVPVRAARAGDVDALRAWASNGGDPNAADDEGWTPLTAAAAHGRAEAVDFLLAPDVPGASAADPSVRLREADMLALHLAAQAGDLPTVRALLRAAPEHLHATSSVNGHTLLLQAAFYGKQKHLDIVRWLLDEFPQEHLALLAAPNVRGYDALTMQDLWHNERMRALLLSAYPGGVDGEFAHAVAAARAVRHERLMLAIASAQSLTEKLHAAIADFLEADDAEAARIERRIDAIISQPHFEIDRRGGDLEMPALVFALTGVDVGRPERARRRRAIVRRLLDAGADPAVREKHPMGVGAVIRAAVLNNFELLQLLAESMSAEAFAVELNVRPAVNGLTALHDAIHRALTSPPEQLAGRIAQIVWMRARGARADLPDNTGQTQRGLAEAALHDAAFAQETVRAVLEVLG